MINLTFEPPDTPVSSYGELVSATEKQMETASEIALKETSKWLKTQVKRKISEAIGISQKSFADRLFISSGVSLTGYMFFWIGTWRISPFSLGTPRLYGIPYKTGGIQSGRIQFKGGFHAKVGDGGHENVFIRLHSPHFNPTLFANTAGSPNPTKTSARLPIMKAGLDIQEEAQKAVDAMWPQLPAVFEEKYIKRLDYEVNIRGGLL